MTPISHTVPTSVGMHAHPIARGLTTMARVAAIAAPVFLAAHMAASMPQAEAGPIAYAACIAACTGSIFAAPFCPAICAPLLLAPTP